MDPSTADNNVIVDIADIDVTVPIDEQFPFIAPLVKVLKSSVELCDRAIVNKAASKQYKDRLLEVEQVVQVALNTIGKSEAASIKPYIDKLHGIIVNSAEFIESNATKGFLSKITRSKKAEGQHFEDLDRQLAEVMRDMSFAVGLAQYKIVAKTYEIFNYENFIDQKGGPEAVKADEKVLEELAGHLDCSVNDLRKELIDIDNSVKEMREDLRTNLQQLKKLIESPTQETPEIKDRLLSVDRECLLGEGAMGLVFAGKYNGQDVAIKTLKRLPGKSDDETIRQLQQEVKILFILGKYPGFVRLFGANLEPAKGELSIVLELADGSLDELIHSDKLQVNLTFALKTTIALDIACAMDALHELGIIFRDLKPPNVLIFFKGQERQVVAKLTDFGLAKRVFDKTSSTNAGGNIKGTIPYMAPEFFQDSSSRVPYSFASDVYAFGVTLNELMTEQRPFHNFNGNSALLMRLIESGHNPELFRCSTDDLPAHKAMESILESCMARDRFVRPRMSAVVENLQRVCSAAAASHDQDYRPHDSEAGNLLLSPSKSHKKLSELSVDDVLYLMHKLEMPDKCLALVRDQKITGKVLSHTESLEDLRECGFQSEVLGKFHAKSLLESVSSFKMNGIPPEYLRNADVFFSGKTQDLFCDPIIPRGGIPPLPREDPGQKKSLVDPQSLGLIRRYCAEATQKNVSPLYLASEAGDIEGAQALLQCTHEMVQNESEDVKKYMREDVAERVNKAEEEKDQRTPLHIAAINGKTETVTLLLTQKANIEAKTKDQRTPLHIVAEEGHTETVSALITHKANIVAKDKNMRTPLHIAAHQGHPEIVSLLITLRANIEAKDSSQSTPLLIAVAQGHSETASLLITLRANIDTKDMDQRTLLHIAAEEGQTETVSLLIKQRVKLDPINEEQQTPLHCAVERGHEEIVSLLLSNKANVDALDEIGSTPLCLAIGGGNKQIISLLLTHEASTVVGWEPLHMAVMSGNKELVSLLLARKTNIEAKDEDQLTPIFHAVENGDAEMVSLLIKHNANVNVKDEYGETLLEIAEDDGIKTILKSAKSSCVCS